MKLGKIISGKKSESDISARKVIFYVIFGILATITFLFIVLIVPSNSAEISRTPAGLDNYIFFQRFLNSPSCFAAEDADTNLVLPYIDAEKFTQETLNNCYNVRDANIKAFRIKLKYNGVSKQIATKNWEGFLSKAQTERVFVFTVDEIKNAELFVEVQDAE